MKSKQFIKEYRKEDGELNIELIVNKYFSYIYKIITNSSIKCFSREDIEEIIYDVFFVIWKNSEILDDERILEPYIAEVTRRLLLKKSRNKCFEVSIEEDSNLISEKGIEQIIEEKEKRKNLYIQINLLSEIDKAIFIKFYYDGLKIKEIAEQLSMNDFNVKTRLHRVRKKLKKYLEEGGYSDGIRNN